MEKVKQKGFYVCLHIGLNKSIQDMMIKKTNLWIYPGCDHDQSLQNYINNPKSEFPLVYISFPSEKDNSWGIKYPNSCTIEAIIPNQMSWYSNLKSKIWKKRGSENDFQKEKLSKNILEVVYKRIPKLKDSIDFLELSTLLKVKSLVNYFDGEIYGLDHSPKKLRKRWLKPSSEIKNLFLMGQDVTTDSVSSALFSGIVTASAVLKKDLTSSLKN